MPSIAITGSIGSGKSESLHLLGKTLGASKITSLFSADDENRKLLNSDLAVKEEIITKLGARCYQADGCPDKEFLFSIISTNPEARRTLEQIMHPRIELLWRPEAKKYAKSESSFFIAEIPLLFEKALESLFTTTIVVACSDSVRKERLNRRSLSSEKAEGWMNLQLSQLDKISKSDHVIWNDGSHGVLKKQIDLMASHLLNT
jgi:dephospho-CoA kinase